MCGGSNSVVDDIVSGATQVLSGGTLDYNPSENKLKGGIVTNTTVDIVKDITGASAAEEANKQARKQFDAETAARRKEQEDKQARTAANQLQASRSAASSRRSASNKSAASKGSGFSSSAVSNLGSDEQDFLGL